MVAYLALFVALGGTGAYAADTIGSSDVIDESLLSQDVKDGEVMTPDLADAAVTRNKLAATSVTAGKINNNAVDASKIPDDALTGADVLESSLGIVPNADTIDGIDSAGFMRSGVTPASGDLTGIYPGPDIRAGSVAGRELRGFRVVEATTNISGGAAENGSWVTGTTQANCLPGERVITGGAYWKNGAAPNSALMIVQSRPFFNVPGGWIASAGNDSGALHELAVLVLCLPQQ